MSPATNNATPDLAVVVPIPTFLVVLIPIEFDAHVPPAPTLLPTKAVLAIPTHFWVDASYIKRDPVVIPEISTSSRSLTNPAPPPPIDAS